MANHDRARKLLVRSALVTSATIATAIGAENLALLDANNLNLKLTPNAAQTALNPDPAAAASAPIQQAAPDLIIRRAAPNLVVLRHAGQQTGSSAVVNNAATAPSTTLIQPPASAQISIPSPVVVQLPVFQTSQSSQ